jgi:hypothetical protein
MAWWIYKCNSRQHSDQVAWGDWRDFFDGDSEREWGSTRWVPALADLSPGDMILAYQTDRNELVGLAEVATLAKRRKNLDLILRPIERIGVKVRPLKNADLRIASIPALQPGPIMTVYPIEVEDAHRLLTAAGAEYVPNGQSARAHYWMFTVMHDWFPTLWTTMVRRGIAAQHYPPDWSNETRNIRALEKLKRGDWLVAAFMRHRFAGYGQITTDFARRGRSLSIPGRDGPLEFQERVSVDWKTIPLGSSKPFVVCEHLKHQGYDVDLVRGLCVKQINKATFDQLRNILDDNGATGVGNGQPRKPELNKLRLTPMRGAGFGCPEENPLVERAAIKFVTARYIARGWRVTSVERDKCGFDLRCQKGRRVEEVEVKGVSGTIEAFMITAGEVKQAESNPYFVICVVTNATSGKPKMASYSGRQFLERFRLSPTQYRASLPAHYSIAPHIT